MNIHPVHFMDLNGRICCVGCLGMEALSEYRHRPKARTLRTSMTVWQRLTQVEIDDFRADCGIDGPTCEDCRYRAEREAVA